MGFKVFSPYYTDGYKLCHKKMSARGLRRLYGTMIPRSLKHMHKSITKVVSAGASLTWRWLHDEWQENFFEQPIEEAKKFGKDMSLYLGVEYDVSHFEELHKLGYLPIRVKALPEGLQTKPNIAHMTFINTVDGFGWFTLYLETIVSALSWKTTVSATIAQRYRRNAMEWIMKTDPDNAFLIDFMCHDFSARGLDPFSMIAISLGHAMSFRGSDTLVAIPAARYFYGESEEEVCINSVNASEHSVSTTKIFTVGEKQMIIDWLKEFPTGILSIVADTFDLWKLLQEYVASPEVKELILARDGKLVIRPDSGDPVTIICGKQFKVFSSESFGDEETDIKLFKQEVGEYLDDIIRVETPHGEYGGEITQDVIWNGVIYTCTYDPDWNRHDKQYYYIDNWGPIESNVSIEKKDMSAADIGVIDILWDTFGGTVNKQGYKLLDPHIGAIYGDAITLDRQVDMYSRLEKKGYAATNILLGVGSYTYQMVTRDTAGIAVKGGWFDTYDGEEFGIYKDPITDDGTKKSPKGLLQVFNNRPDCNGDELLWDGEDVIEMRDNCTHEQEEGGLLQLIYEDGVFYNPVTLTTIRERLF